MTDLWNAFAALHWLTPGAFWLAVLVPLALWCGRPRRGLALDGLMLERESTPGAPDRRARPWPGAPRTWRDRTAWLPPVATGLGLCAVVAALARPAERHALPADPRGTDIVLCLDTSSSMAARDLDPERSRLTVAQAAAARFVAGRQDDRIGLVSFARFPDLRCPPTHDHRALLAALGSIGLVAADSAEDLTGIGTALAEAAQALGVQGGLGTSAGPDKATNRVVILLTDGEETVAHAAAADGDAPTEIGPRAAARICEALGVRIYAIAIGARDRVTGRALDTTELAEVATIADGAFFEAADAASLARIYARIDELEATAPGAIDYELHDRFEAFLAGGLVLLALGWLGGRTIWRLET